MRGLLLIGVFALTGCSTQPGLPGAEVPNTVRCAPMPGDIVRESKARTPVKRGITDPNELVTVAGDLALAEERKNRALGRAIRLYAACRRA